MCYSKEVQLATGSTILLTSLGYYISYSIKFHALSKKWLMSFLKNVITAFALIGGHQIFEFLSLATNSQVIYKIGLLLSISSMFFFLRALEVMLNRDLRSKIALWIIGIVTLHSFSVELPFAANSFYVQHQAGFIWAFGWMLLFFYFHVCALRGSKLLASDDSRKAILFYLIATLDISFILSIAYTLWGYWRYSTNVCTDSPSIWCTFYVIQVVALPFFLSVLPKILHRPRKHTVQTFKDTDIYLVIAFVILVALVATLPFFNCLSFKFAFP